MFFYIYEIGILIISLSGNGLLVKVMILSLLIGDIVYKVIIDCFEGNMVNYFNRGFSLFCVKCLYFVIIINFF